MVQDTIQIFISIYREFTKQALVDHMYTRENCAGAEIMSIMEKMSSTYWVKVECLMRRNQQRTTAYKIRQQHFHGLSATWSRQLRACSGIAQERNSLIPMSQTILIVQGFPKWVPWHPRVP